MVEYSCGIFSDFARVMHVPSISPSKALRIAMPIVSAWPIRVPFRQDPNRTHH